MTYFTSPKGAGQAAHALASQVGRAQSVKVTRVAACACPLQDGIKGLPAASQPVPNWVSTVFQPGKMRPLSPLKRHPQGGNCAIIRIALLVRRFRVPCASRGPEPVHTPQEYTTGNHGWPQRYPIAPPGAAAGRHFQKCPWNPADGFCVQSDEGITRSSQHP